MILEFSNILVKYSNYIKDSKIDIDELTWIIQSSSKVSTIYKKDERIQTTVNNMETTCSVPKYMRIISCYCSFFNFELLKVTFDSIDYKEGKLSLSKYKNRFDKYVERRVIHCPSGLGMKDMEHTLVSIKLDDTFKGCRGKHILTLQRDICEILKVEVHIMPFEGVEWGCICIVFHLPLALKKMFPLSLIQIDALKLLHYNEARVLSISCDDYFYEVNNEQGMFVSLAVLLVTRVSSTLRNYYKQCAHMI